MNSRTRLAFFILKTHAGWIVRADGFVYPPCTDQIDALTKAIREAQAAERLGFASVVLAQSAAGEPCHVRWCCAGNDGAAQAVMEPPYPVIPAMTDILTPGSVSEGHP